MGHIELRLPMEEHSEGLWENTCSLVSPLIYKLQENRDNASFDSTSIGIPQIPSMVTSLMKGPID